MDKLKFETPDIVGENIEKIGALFPSAVTEMKDENGKVKKGINFEVLKQLLSRDVVDGDECYEFTWVGKKAAMAEAARPTTKTLRPVKEDSRDWDTTENLYIEGDNLEVLKILQESYLGKVKMIYIDPPYNTGHDFVYPDSFAMDDEEYSAGTGYFDEDGNVNFARENSATAGKYHSDWCSMMYSRLTLARNLLADDGIVFISIDDAEIANLRKICDEILGTQNFVACLVYDKNRKNDAKYFSVGHEYMLVYFKSFQTIYEEGIIFREPKEGVDDVRAEFEKLRKLYDDDWTLVNEGLKKLYASWAKDDIRKPLARFTKVDKFGPYRDDGNISWPGGGGPKYEVIHPVTKKPCKCPDAGWRFPTLARMQEEIENGRVVFGTDETTLPRIRRNLFDFDTQVMRSVHFSYAQTATLEFNRLFDNFRVFENPKSITDIKKLIRYVTTEQKNCIVLDFFSGSATTAHAVMQLNAEDGGHRKFIMVQLPEPCDEKSEAFKAGYTTICEIGKERIRRAGDKIKEEHPLETKDLDTGFRVFRVDSSNMKDVYYHPDELDQMSLMDMVSNIKDDRTDMDLLYACLLDWGVEINLPHTSTELDGCTIHNVDNGALIACFNEKIPASVIEYMAQQHPLRAVFRDSAFTADDAKINVTETFKNFSPDTSVKVL